MAIRGGIHIARKLPTPIKSGSLQKRLHVALRRHERPQTAEDARYIEESMHGLYSSCVARKAVSYYFNQTYEYMEDRDTGTLIVNDDTAFLSDVDFSRFADTAFVEFHGCRTAEYKKVFNDLVDNFAENFSEKLPPDGTTVGHIHNAVPNNHPSGNRDDYRQGRIRSYKNGMLDGDNIERWGQKFVNSSTPPL